MDKYLFFVLEYIPGGDFGKRELSPALRNRLVEIWCPSPMEIYEDVDMILNEKLLHLPNQLVLKGNSAEIERRKVLISTIHGFVQWFQESKTKSTLTSYEYH